MVSTSVSPLKPIDPADLPDYEKEDQAPWVMRKLVGSMMGRVVMASFETLKATGTNIVCLSAWGDSSPLFLPCIMWRDVIIQSVIAATGGTAAIAGPAMGPAMEAAMGGVGQGVAVELAQASFQASTEVADDLISDKTFEAVVPVHSGELTTTGFKTLIITAEYKHRQVDAVLGYFRASVHSEDVEVKDGLFSSLSDYLSIEKGWFNPILFASGRRPCVPRSMKPDVIFCHGPYHEADYQVAQSLVSQCAKVIKFADPVAPTTPPPAPKPASPDTSDPASGDSESSHSLGGLMKKGHGAAGELLKVGQDKLKDARTRSRPSSLSPDENPATAAAGESAPADEIDIQPSQPQSPPPRRLAILLVGISPHRKLWTTSARPEESVIRYTLLDGAPAIVVPAEDGCPLIAWDTLTLASLHKVPDVEGAEFDGVVNVLFEYVSLCADWARFELPKQKSKLMKSKLKNEDAAKEATKDALTMLVAAAVRSKESKEVKKHIDVDRAGIAMLRLP